MRFFGAVASAFAFAFFCFFLEAFFPEVSVLAAAKLSIAAISVVSERCAYQTSMVDISANSAIVSR